ncbi:hypothetical protein OsJ_28872 [Oryza sativa Japonica Group]|uniref:F-box domain-containing protein n=1 Tax=Oryza sativa subsp. japonica TaxID=39947 RepID=A3BXG7_ORYSJ|nr:hypothetical protein OsJ_28872 [Oryza sativa Japonica Group]
MARSTTTLDDIPDTLLKHVLVGLSSPVCIVRAAATCRRWRRIIARSDYTRALRFPPLLDAGHYQAVDLRYAAAPRPCGGKIVYVPSASVDARRLALDFLPGGGSASRSSWKWELVDSEGGLLLLAKTRRRRFPELIVCDPLARRHVVIPPIPDKKYSHCLAVFFWNWNGGPNLSDFTLRCVLHEGIDGAAGGVTTARVYDFKRHYWSHHRKYLDRCLRGGSCGDRSGFRFIDGDNPDDVRLVSVVGGDLKVFLRRDGSGDAWEPEKNLSLRDATSGMPGRKESYFGGAGAAAKIVSAGAGYVVLTPAEETWLFSVELATMEVERKHSRNRYAGEFFPYHPPWPPTLSAHVSYCKRNRKGLCFQICVC